MPLKGGLLLLHEVGHRGKVVTVPVQPHTAGMGALGRPLVLAGLLDKIIAAENVITVKGQFLVVLVLPALYHVLAEDNLVEKVPTALIGEGALSLTAEDVPPGIVEVTGLYVLLLALGSQELCHGTVVGVIVHVSHHHDMHPGLAAAYAVRELAHLLAAPVAELALCGTAGPVAHDDGKVIPGQFALDGKETAGLVCGVSIFIYVLLQEGLLHQESLGVVEEGTIHTTAVRPLDVHELIAALLHARLVDQVLHHTDVLYLRNTYEAGSIGKFVGAKVTEYPGHVGQLMLVFEFVPMVGTGRQEVVVVLARIVERVEQILQVVERHSVAHQLSVLGLQGHTKRDKGKQQQTESFHRYHDFASFFFVTSVQS